MNLNARGSSAAQGTLGGGFYGANVQTNIMGGGIFLVAIVAVLIAVFMLKGRT